jgi:beta-glucosidase/6-phospho-beta-glucosidase/beta-galactosidase
LLRVVAFRKAVLAGAAGAIAWEAALRTAISAGLPFFDIVRELGTLVFPSSGPLFWWPAGLAAHASVGFLWIVFYGYFFWGRFKLPPVLQGLLFAVLPLTLATLLAVPQVRLMHLHASIVHLDAKHLFEPLSWWTLAGLLIGHAIFGATAGAIYSHPVGYRPGHEPPPPGRTAARSHRGVTRKSHDGRSFMFTTGIECSYPTIENGRWRRDQMAATRHYSRWRDDFERAREVGVSHIRYGPPLHLVFTAPGQYDWDIIDEPMRELCEIGPEPIVDLCHFGLPEWLGNFQNAELVSALSDYAGAFAGRYPGVRFYTPINEMYVCAKNSALQGLWNEQLRDEGAFLTAVLNLANASIAMSDSILKSRPDALFINSESSEFCQPCCPDPKIRKIAELENERRFLPLDLIYAHPVSDPIRDRLRDHGLSDGDYDRFMNRKVPRRSVLGVDYYEWNEKLIDSRGNPRALGELFGWYVIASQYWQRYKRVMMHTETNRMDAADAPRWLWRQWHNVQLLRSAGVPIIGFTWYSLIDQVDWDIGISRALGVIFPVGLFDLNRDPRAVGLSYKYLIDTFGSQPEYKRCAALEELLG